ncbi:E3 ubiquitin-protein ligase rnf213-beta isoform X2 [Acipenser ruthenus]|uniref:E3 ubiquitin-protein ligase rnf213-beta isoform X2 n=1 Tax=Acipenser ruthenus TaxID=7906 RepID=UPI002740B25A|nr:E3 ubiquitin-protein ligase rnf213-beta isoform X2 [Acipenser ruthenus]
MEAGDHAVPPAGVEAHGAATGHCVCEKQETVSKKRKRKKNKGVVNAQDQVGNPEISELSPGGGITRTDDNGNPAVREASTPVGDTVQQDPAPGSEQPQANKRHNKRNKKQKATVDCQDKSLKNQREEGRGQRQAGSGQAQVGKSKATQTETVQEQDGNKQSKHQETQTDSNQTQSTETQTESTPEQGESQPTQQGNQTGPSGDKQEQEEKAQPDTENKQEPSQAQAFDQTRQKRATQQNREEPKAGEVLDLKKDGAVENQNEGNLNKGGKAKTTAEQTAASPARTPSEKPMFTIYVYLVLDKGFKFRRGQDKLLLLFLDKEIALQINVFRDLSQQKSGCLIEGQISVDVSEFRGRLIYYNYAVQKRSDPIPEISTRIIEIPYDRQINELHRYEGHVHCRESWSFRGWFSGIFTSKEEGIWTARQAAGKVLLGQVFQKLVPLTTETKSQFFQHLSHFCNCFNFPEYYPEMQPMQFGAAHVSALILEQVFLFLEPYTQTGSRKRRRGSPAVGRNPLAAGLLAFQVVNCQRLQLSLKEWAVLCQLMQLPTSPSEELKKNLEEVKILFDDVRFTVIGLINCCAQNGVVELALVVPLLHQLSKSSEGSGTTDSGRTTPERSRAALEGVHYLQFREKIRTLSDKRRMLLDLMDQHKTLMDSDPLLVHSWLALVPTEDIPIYSKLMGIVLEHIFQNVLYRLKECQGRGNNNQVEKDLQAINENISFITLRIEEDKERLMSSGVLNSLFSQCISIHKSVCSMARLVQLYKGPLMSFQLALKTAEALHFSIGKEPPAGAEKESKLFETLEETQNHFRQWRDALLQRPLLVTEQDVRFTYNKELELWDSLLGVECAVEGLTAKWRSSVERDLSKRFAQETPWNQILIFCLNQPDLAKASQAVHSCFVELQQQAITDICQNKKEWKLLEKISPCSKSVPSPILSAIILESRQRAVRDGDDLVGWLLRPHTALNYLLSQKDLQSVEVSDKAREALTEGQTVLASLAEGLLQGTISVTHLNLTLEHRDTFIKLYRQQQKQSKAVCFQADVEKMLLHREWELKSFKQEKEHIGMLIKMIKKITESVTVTELSSLEQQHRAEHLSKRLNELVEVHPWSSSAQEPSAEPPAVLCYHVSWEVRGMAQEMHRLQQSTLLLNGWMKRANHLATLETRPWVINLVHVLLEIWRPCLDEYRNLSKKIANGSVKFQEVDEVLGILGGREAGVKMIERELGVMTVVLEKESYRQGWTRERQDKIQQYCKLHHAIDSASAMLRIARKLQLTGNFVEIQQLTQLREDSFKQSPLSSLRKELIAANDQLDGVTAEEIACLEEFLGCQEIVSWVKDNLKNMSDVKVFVDLASISAGENDTEIDSVACFHDAVMGYSPFLYSLSPEADFQVLMKCSQEVWKARDRDPKLSEKLRDSNRCLDWLKGLRETHGSVEQSSLSLAAAINSQGLYRVGETHFQQGKRSLQSLLRLTVRNEGAEKRHGLEELLELQNKLMLMSSKGEHGKEQVNRFMQVFDGVQRLGRILLDLHVSGNMFFRKWEAFIHCSPDSTPCITVNFNLQGVGAVRFFGEVTEQLQALCRSMEFCHNDWCCFVNEARSTFYPLNYYTAEQIVYLCGQLRERPSVGLPQQVLAMLSFVKPGCTLKEVYETWTQEVPSRELLTAGVDSDEESIQLNNTDGESSDFELQDADEEHRESSPRIGIAYDIESEGEEENISVHSNEGSEDLISLEDSDALVDDIEEEKKGLISPELLLDTDEEDHGKPGVARGSSQEMSPDQDSDTEGQSVDMADLWRLFREDMTTYLDGHLDIISLSRFLQCLSESNRKKVNRTLHPVLKEGIPNLVLCPGVDVLSTALGLYMESPDQPLPSCDEALLCGKDTTGEQVEIFLRRALGLAGRGGRGKIFTLISPGLLPYDVGVMLGEKFEDLEKSTEPHYRLVIVCSLKLQHRYVPSFFSNYKVQAGLAVSTEKARSYLQRHFTVPPQSHLDHTNVFPGCQSVWVLSSTRPAVGKSLYVDRLFEKLQQFAHRGRLVRIRLTDPRIEEDSFLQTLFKSLVGLEQRDPVILHIDAAAVRTGLEEFLFRLLVLGCLANSEGKLWRRNPAQLLVMELLIPRAEQNWTQQEQPKQGLLNILPTIHCRPPEEVRQLELERKGAHMNILHPLMDRKEFASEGVQRPYQYLKRYNQKESIDTFRYQEGSKEGNPAECLFYLLTYCGIKDPSWAELRNFTWFLNLQLKDCEGSLFCDTSFVGQHLLGFKRFIVGFMIVMARDFATPSMEVSDQSTTLSEKEDDGLIHLTIRKRWESEPHPYIFFNADHLSMSFLGFHLKMNHSGTCDAVDPHSGKVLMGDVMSVQLLKGLERQGISFSEDFDSLPREKKIQKLSRVLGDSGDQDMGGGFGGTFDPDSTYELTADNVMKMLAIHMRFRCEIPVIIMGETGCGKTRLVRFLCDLQRGNKEAKNMMLVKVHGGTTAEMIYKKVKEAEELAENNRRHHRLDTILFFDEANTTESIFAIKEVLCDRTVRGQPLKANTGLKIIAACNPYRKHSREMIRQLELAGLGYRVKAGDTGDRLGKVPLRQLVYRVQPLPPSMVPLIWDFGQLSNSAELSYTKQIVQRQVMEHRLPRNCADTVSSVLAGSQQFMRSRKNECSFVSLRDVERSMRVLVWFYNHRVMVFPKSVVEEDVAFKCLALAVGVCYYPSLVSKMEYLQFICRYFPKPLNSAEAIKEVISTCQDVFLQNIKTRETVAKNTALKENVFLMVVCIELRIPLFLVGKPGSSKSLAKTVVADAMQGRASHCQLFKQLKQVHMVSFQCSPHSSPEGIIGIFRQCARFQQSKSMEEYVSVVVLDEIGLAEDSPQMPLKTLHPLLEDGCIDNDSPDPHMKVGFVGISNWALDPAKMNRGIFVSRWDPSEKELIKTAKGICSSDQTVQMKIKHLFPTLAKAFLGICRAEQTGQFFGLRDYYSLVKMIFASARESQAEPSEDQLAEAILRNFSGGREGFDPLQSFNELFQSPEAVTRPGTLSMVERNLDQNKQEASRYLLLLTTNNAALHILQQRVFGSRKHQAPEIVFGSGFPRDQEYAQVCRNVNRVKTCMETGRTVVLLNLQNLYESLYDALNQYYVYLGGQQYVDLGLGTHRVKCRVHQGFRLVVVEDQNKVYTQFPVPLINRLEKHHLDMSAVLTPQQQRMLQRLTKWVQEFTQVAKGDNAKFGPTDAFIGFHADACASALLQAASFVGQGWRKVRVAENQGKEGKGHLEEMEMREEDVQMEDVEERGQLEGSESEAQLMVTEDQGQVGDTEGNDYPGETQADHMEEGEEEVQKENAEGEGQLKEGNRRDGEDSQDGQEEEEVLGLAKSLLLHCATPDAVLRLKHSDLGVQESKELRIEYFHQQHHSSLRDYLEHHLSGTETQYCRFIEVTTFSSLLTQSDIRALAQSLGMETSKLLLLSLHQFDTEFSFCTKIRSFLRLEDCALQVLLVQTDTEESLHSEELIASAKYCAMNEMSSLEPGLSQSYVFFITKLPRITGGTQYAGFQGGAWLSAHIDDLRDSVEMSSDLSAFCDVSISQLFTRAMEGPHSEANSAPGEQMVECKRGGCPELDCISLLRSCIQSAVGLLRDSGDKTTRSTERVQTLLRFMGEEEGTPEAEFVHLLMGRLCAVLAHREEHAVSPGEWVCNEAKKLQALQEGGTLRHTLWRCLQAVVTPVLARMVEVLDRDGNLNLFHSPQLGMGFTQLWLDIFRDPQILELPYHQPSGQADLEIPVQNSLFVGQKEVPSAAPFSWLIRLHSQNLWEESQFVPGAEEGEKRRLLQFVGRFSCSRLGGYIRKLGREELKEFGQRYLRDFLLLTWKISSGDELELFTAVVHSFVLELQQDLSVESPDLSPAWILAAVTYYRPRLTNLSRILHLHPELLRMVLKGTEPTAHEVNADVLAVGGGVEVIENSAIESILDCRRFLQKVELLHPCVEQTFGQEYRALCSMGCQRQLDTSRSCWHGVLVVAAFIEQVVLSVAKTDPPLVELAVKHCALLNRFVRTSPDMRRKEALEGVMRVLHSCNEESSHLHFRFGIKNCSVCLNPLRQPTSLPCEHVFCLPCLSECLSQGRAYCPECKTNIPPNHQPAVSPQLEEGLRQHGEIRQQCNSFFLEVVSRFCLSEGETPGEGVVELLFSLLISAQGDVFRTRELTPFLECVDRNPVIRSVLPKLLLHYSLDQVKTHMQRYLQNLEENILDREDRTELYLLFVNCFQDALSGPGEEGSELGQDRLQDGARFLSRVARRQTPTCQEDPVEFLQSVARLRVCLGTAASLLHQALSGTECASSSRGVREGYLEQVKAVLEYSGNDWHRIYLLRALTRQFGMDCLLALLKKQHWAFPPKLIQIQSKVPTQVDRFLCVGSRYKDLRNAVFMALLNKQTEPVAKGIQDGSPSTACVLLTLALFRQVTCLFAQQDPGQHPGPQETQPLQEFIRGSPRFCSKEQRDFCSALVANQLGGAGSSCCMVPELPTQRHTLLEIIVHAGAVFLSGSRLLSPLQQIATRPETMTNMFLPTMPEDKTSEAHQWVKEKGTWYYCANGHACIVGECGRPMITSRCADCGAPVGGIQHNPVPGFTKASSMLADRTRTGHILGAAQRGAIVACDRQMSPAAFSLLRLCTHIAMLLGAFRNKREISAMISPAVGNVEQFLWRHIENDMEALGRSLGRNMDDTAVCIHLVIHAFLNSTAGSQRGEGALSSKRARQDWEKLVCDTVITPALQDLERSLRRAQKVISTDDRLSGSPLMKVLYGDPTSILDLPTQEATDHSSFWSCPERVTIERFTQILEQDKGQEDSPVLWLFLKKERVLRLLKHLPDLAALQTDLLRTFPVGTDMGSQTIGQLLQKLPAGYQKEVLRRRVKVFMELWNLLRTEVASSHGTEDPQGLSEAVLTVESSSAFLSLQRRGPGSCLSTLIEFLTETHNSLVRKANNQAKEDDSVPLEGVTESQLTLCDPERDLLPLILAHCQYTLEKGKETVSHYDMPAIESHLKRRYLQGKPVISAGTSKYLNRQQQDFSLILAEVRSKIEQEALKGSDSAAVSTVLRSYSDVCDAVRIVETGLRFLGKTGGEPKGELLTYLRDTLRMGKQISSAVGKALNECRLEHSTSVWQLLTSWKSELMLRKGKDPFERLPIPYREGLSEVEKKELRGFLAVTDINAFRWELHEILLLKTNNFISEDNYHAHWDLKSTLEIHLEEKGSLTLPGLEGLSDAITLKKGAESWRLAVEFRR